MDAANRRAQEEVFARTKAGRQAGRQAQEANTSEGVQETRSVHCPGARVVTTHQHAHAFMGLVSLSWAWFRGSRGHGMTLHGRYGWNVVNVPVAEPGGRVSPGTRLPLMPGTYQQQPFGP